MTSATPVNSALSGSTSANVADLGWADRVRVVRARAEEAGRREDLRGTFDLVVARGFGPPAVTAECGRRGYVYSVRPG